jgi:hypothetical protein
MLIVKPNGILRSETAHGDRLFLVSVFESIQNQEEMRDDRSTDNINDSPFIRSDVWRPHPKMRCHQQFIDSERILITLIHSIGRFEKPFDRCGC